MSDDFQQMELNFEIRGTKHTLIIPASKNQMLTAQHILNGETYPVPNQLSNIIDCVFDIGGNVGIASIYFHLHFPNAKIHTYEPNKHSFLFLENNTKNFPQVEISNCGLFNTNTEIPINICSYGGERSSIKEQDVPAGGTHIAILKEAASEISDKAHDADNICLKIDTEGCEVEILKNIKNLFDKIACLYIEYHSEADRIEIDNLLVKNNFFLYSGRILHPHRGEFFYIKEQHLEKTGNWDRFLIA